MCRYKTDQQLPTHCRDRCGSLDVDGALKIWNEIRASWRSEEARTMASARPRTDV